HKSLVNFLTSMQRRPGFSAHDSILAVTTFSFDISLLEILLPLVSGGSVIIATHRQAKDPFALIDLLQRSQPSTLQGTPTFFRMLATAGWQGNHALKVLCGGERLDIVFGETLM